MKISTVSKQGEMGVTIWWESGDKQLSTGEVDTAIKNFLSCQDEPGEGVDETPPVIHSTPKPVHMTKPEVLFDCAEALDTLPDNTDQKDIVRALGGYVGGGV